LRDPALFEKLTTESELSGILNLLLFRSQAIGKSGQIHKRAGAEMFAEYTEQSSSVATFLELFCEYDSALSGLWTPSEPIYEAYQQWCELRVGEVVDIRYFGRQIKKFCGGSEPKRGKNKERKSTSEYKGLIFDNQRYNEIIKSLKLSMSQSVSIMFQSNYNEEENEKSQQISMSQLSQSNLWNEIIEKFGSESQGKNLQNSMWKEKANLIETIETTETSIASSFESVDSNRDKTETLIETKPGIGPHPRRSEPKPRGAAQNLDSTERVPPPACRNSKHAW
ncbi:MAG TPA: hypothetical protein PKL79_08940, partial [Rectinema sp.]|nr:hypothetical protein [Rectinema sp.]